jgi:hypothetical protein
VSERLLPDGMLTGPKITIQPVAADQPIDRQLSVGGREATAHPVVCSRQLASHCCLFSTSYVSPLCESSHATALPEFQ